MGAEVNHDWWWCWPPLAIWSSVLMSHLGCVCLARRRAGRSPREVPEVTDDHQPSCPAVPAERPPPQPFYILVTRDGNHGQLSGSGMVDGAVD
jgi:hypothetical protein